MKIWKDLTIQETMNVNLADTGVTGSKESQDRVNMILYVAWLRRGAGDHVLKVHVDKTCGYLLKEVNTRDGAGLNGMVHRFHANSEVIAMLSCTRGFCKHCFPFTDDYMSLQPTVDIRDGNRPSATGGYIEGDKPGWLTRHFANAGKSDCYIVKPPNFYPGMIPNTWCRKTGQIPGPLQQLDIEDNLGPASLGCFETVYASDNYVCRRAKGDHSFITLLKRFVYNARKLRVKVWESSSINTAAYTRSLAGHIDPIFDLKTEPQEASNSVCFLKQRGYQRYNAY